MAKLKAEATPCRPVGAYKVRVTYIPAYDVWPNRLSFDFVGTFPSLNRFLVRVEYPTKIPQFEGTHLVHFDHPAEGLAWYAVSCETEQGIVGNTFEAASKEEAKQDFRKLYNLEAQTCELIGQHPKDRKA